MIAFDTNLVLRLLLDDDPSQTSRIVSLLKANRERVLIDDITLAETAWGLRTIARRTPAQILDTMEILARSDHMTPSGKAIEPAMMEARRYGMDIADALIGTRNRTAGCGTTYTFDRRAARSDLFTLVP